MPLFASPNGTFFQTPALGCFTKSTEEPHHYKREISLPHGAAIWVHLIDRKRDWSHFNSPATLAALDEAITHHALQNGFCALAQTTLLTTVLGDKLPENHYTAGLYTAVYSKTQQPNYGDLPGAGQLNRMVRRAQHWQMTWTDSHNVQLMPVDWAKTA